MAEHVERAINYNIIAAKHITTRQSFRGRLYSSVALKNDELGLVDINKPHPNLLIATDITTLYWGLPGHPYDPDSRCQTILHNKKLDETLPHEVEAAKRLILGAAVSEIALAQTSQEYLKVGRALVELIGQQDAERLIEDMYAEASAPMAMVRVGTILRGERANSPSIGLQTALLWHPPVWHPSVTLAAIQRAIIGDKSQPIQFTL